MGWSQAQTDTGAAAEEQTRKSADQGTLISDQLQAENCRPVLGVAGPQGVLEPEGELRVGGSLFFQARQLTTTDA